MNTFGVDPASTAEGKQTSLFAMVSLWCWTTTEFQMPEVDFVKAPIAIIPTQEAPAA